MYKIKSLSQIVGYNSPYLHDLRVTYTFVTLCGIGMGIAITVLIMLLGFRYYVI